jgi:hypothetical protein
VAILVFVMVLGAKAGIMAQEKVLISVNMFKDVSTLGETYGISFDLADEVLKKVAQVYVWGPKGARIWVNNTLDLNDISLSAVNLTLEEFNRWFPPGTYRIDIKPMSYGSLTVSMTHNFPPAPAIINPLQGAVNVSTNPIILWAPVTGITSLQLQIRDAADFVLNVDLPVNATSYAVPENLLTPNTRYDLAIRAKAIVSGRSGLTTTSRISFTTKP